MNVKARSIIQHLSHIQINKLMNIKINNTGLFLNGNRVDFPLEVAYFERLSGNLRYTKTKNNHLYTSDEFGVALYAKDQQYAEILTLFFVQEHYKFSPENVFTGSCTINGEDTAIYYEKNRASLQSASQYDNGGIRTIGDLSVYFDVEDDQIRLIEISQPHVEEEPVENNKYSIKKTGHPAIPFTDFNFKLAVIDVLMYEKNRIEPKFDLYDFIRYYKKRRIDIEEEGYHIIPEAKIYFEQLEIEQSLADGIEVLELDSGSEIYHHLYPFWDGEDDTFDVKNFEDIIHFPRLRKITVAYSEEKERALDFLKNKNIAVEFL